MKIVTGAFEVGGTDVFRQHCLRLMKKQLPTRTRMTLMYPSDEHCAAVSQLLASGDEPPEDAPDDITPLRMYVLTWLLMNYQTGLTP